MVKALRFLYKLFLNSIDLITLVKAWKLVEYYKGLIKQQYPFLNDRNHP